MSYGIKYRGQFVKRLDDVICHYHILQKNYPSEGYRDKPNLIEGWTNGTYDTFVSSGISITTAINEGGYTWAKTTGSISLRDGEKIVVIFRFVLTSGIAPVIYFTDGTTLGSNAVTAVAGVNVIELTATSTMTGYIQVDQSAAGDWSTGEVYIIEAISELKCEGNPIIISHQGASADILTPILGSTLKINFQALGTSGLNRQYQEFIYAHNHQYRIDYYEDDDLFWQGFLLPDNYQEQYIAPPYSITLLATDQLGDLKNFKYQRKNGNLISELNYYAGYDTYILEGTKVVSAITDGSHWSYLYASIDSKLKMASTFFSKEGDVIVVTLHLNLISGTLPRIGIFNDDSARTWGSNYVQLANGINRIELILTQDIDDPWFVFENDLNASSWSCGNVLVEFRELIKGGWLQDSIILADCLKHTGLEFEIRENINLSDQTQEYARLDYILSNQEVFIDEKEGIEEPWDCYKVLLEMLKCYGAKILQVNGKWMILRIDNQRAEYNVNRYDFEGKYIDFTTFDPIVQFTSASSPNIVRPINQSGILTSLPGLKYLITKQIFGYINLIRNGGFEDCNKSVRLRRWNRRTMDPRVIRFWDPKLGLTKYYVDSKDEKDFSLVLWDPIGILHYVTSGSTVYDPHIVYTKQIQVGSQIQYLRLKFDTKALANEAAFTAGVLVGVRIWVNTSLGKFALKVVTGTETFMQWRTDAADATILSIPITENDVWKTYELVTNGPIPANISGSINIELHRHYVGPSGSGKELYETHYNNIELYTAKKGTEIDIEEGLLQTDMVPAEEFTEVLLNENNNLLPEDTEYYFGDGYGLQETVPNDLYLYKGLKRVQYRDQVNPTARWTNHGGTYASYKTLIGWLQEFIRIMRTRPSQVFRGTIIGKACSFLSVYQDEANGDIQFFTNIVQNYNPREDIWQIEAVELKPTPIEVTPPIVQLVLDVPVPVLETVAAPSTSIEITSIDTIVDGECSTPIGDVGIDYTNSGAAGSAWVDYEIRNTITEVVVDSGSQYLAFGTGSGTTYLTGLSYPDDADWYTLQAIASENTSWILSDPFRATSPI